LPQIQEHRSGLLAIAYQDVGRAREMADIILAGFPILADADHAVGDAFGVYNLLSDFTHTPAIFILDKNLNTIWSYIGKDVNDRPSAAVVLENLP